jgi:hypothetical protein
VRSAAAAQRHREIFITTIISGGGGSKDHKPALEIWQAWLWFIF